MSKLSSQLAWQKDPGERPFRVVYTKSGEPTACVLRDGQGLVDHLLYWVACQSVQEASYLLAVINSDALAEAVEPLMPKGQFGPRDLHKHLWKLPIPEFDAMPKGQFGPRDLHKHLWKLPIPEFDAAVELHAEMRRRARGGGWRRCGRNGARTWGSRSCGGSCGSGCAVPPRGGPWRRRWAGCSRAGRWVLLDRSRVLFLNSEFTCSL